MALSSKSSSMPSVARSCLYWSKRLKSTFLNIFLKSNLFKALRSILIGNLPRSSGIRSAGLVLLKAPEQMKRIWLVLTSPNLVLIIVPSTSGRRSLCTPSVLGDLPELEDADD